MAVANIVSSMLLRNMANRTPAKVISTWRFNAADGVPERVLTV